VFGAREGIIFGERGGLPKGEKGHFVDGITQLKLTGEKKEMRVIVMESWRRKEGSRYYTSREKGGNSRRTRRVYNLQAAENRHLFLCERQKNLRPGKFGERKGGGGLFHGRAQERRGRGGGGFLISGKGTRCRKITRQECVQLAL